MCPAMQPSNMTVLPLMNRFALLRDSTLTVLCLGLNDGVPKDAEPLNRISPLLEASFNEISNTFHRFRITYYSVVRGRMLLAGVINRDIGVWESDLSTFVRDKY